MSGAAPVVQGAAGAGGGFMNSLGGAALIQGGIGALSAALGGQQEDAAEPLAYWGRDARDGRGGLSPDQVSFGSQGVYGSDSSWQPQRNATAQRLLMTPTGSDEDGNA
jgi:hypothetical protein